MDLQPHCQPVPPLSWLFLECVSHKRRCSRSTWAISVAAIKAREPHAPLEFFSSDLNQPSGVCMGTDFTDPTHIPLSRANPTTPGKISRSDSSTREPLRPALSGPSGSSACIHLRFCDIDADWVPMHASRFDQPSLVIFPAPLRIRLLVLQSSTNLVSLCANCSDLSFLIFFPSIAAFVAVSAAGSVCFWSLTPNSQLISLFGLILLFLTP